MTALEYWRGDPAAIVTELDPLTCATAFVEMIEAARPRWHRQAACCDKPREWWFPEHGQSGRHAIDVCERCPVRDDCLDDALADPALDHGVRGGLSARARTKLRRQRAA